MATPPSSSQPLLACRSLTRYFGLWPALCRVGFQLPAGALVLLLGPNGAGKSTLLHILAGALQASAGQVEIEGLPIASPMARRRVGLLAHRSLLHPDLTVRENLTHYGVLYGLPASAVADVLERVGAASLAGIPVGELSQGMRQKTALARALLHSPRVLLLDEAFASLDRRTVAEMRDILRQFRAEGRAIIASTHAEAQLGDLADGALELERGRLLHARGSVLAELA